MAQLFSSGGVVAEDAIDHVWRIWTEDLDDESWQCLVRWRGEAELSAAVFAMAMNPRTLREPVLAFCRRRSGDPGRAACGDDRHGQHGAGPVDHRPPALGRLSR